MRHHRALSSCETSPHAASVSRVTPDQLFVALPSPFLQNSLAFRHLMDNTQRFASICRPQHPPKARTCFRRRSPPPMSGATHGTSRSSNRRGSLGRGLLLNTSFELSGDVDNVMLSEQLNGAAPLPLPLSRSHRHTPPCPENHTQPIGHSNDAHVPALVAGTDARPARQPGHQLARESLCQKTDYCRFVSCTHTSTRAPEGTAFDVPPPIRTPSPPDIHVDTGHTLAVAARPLLPCRR